MTCAVYMQVLRVSGENPSFALRPYRAPSAGKPVVGC
jgi:hypothetical protein